MQLLINSTQLKKNKEATVHSMSALCEIASALPNVTTPSSAIALD